MATLCISAPISFPVREELCEDLCVPSRELCCAVQPGLCGLRAALRGRFVKRGRRGEGREMERGTRGFLKWRASPWKNRAQAWQPHYLDQPDLSATSILRPRQSTPKTQNTSINRTDSSPLDWTLNVAFDLVCQTRYAVIVKQSNGHLDHRKASWLLLLLPLTT